MEKRYNWDPARNQQLYQERSISFEDVLFALNAGRLLDMLVQPDQDTNSALRVLVVEIDAYAYLVPYTETAEAFFLQGITPSRVATRQYLGAEE